MVSAYAIHAERVLYTQRNLNSLNRIMYRESYYLEQLGTARFKFGPRPGHILPELRLFMNEITV